MDDDKVRILVVDDETDLEQLMLQRMRREIRRGRYEFEFAHNGVEALECLRKNGQFDIVLSDINMPVMDGLTLLEKIPDVNPDIRAVMVSAYGDMENIRTAMNRGAFDFVTKPIDFTDLKITIERAIENLVAWRKAMSTRDKLVSIQNELDVARRMQQDILPKFLPQISPSSDTFDLYASMVPARSVGGDFFDVYEFPDGRIGVAIADVSDKGVPAAMFMMASRTLLKACATYFDSPATVLERVNAMLSDNNDSMTFVTMLYGIYDPETKKFLYANGGHNLPIIVKPDMTIELLESTDGVALGVMEDFEYQEKTVTLEPGSMIVLYTDGVVDAEKENRELFEMDRFYEIFRDVTFTDAKQVTNTIFRTLRDFAGENPQSDDITCLVLRVPSDEDGRGLVSRTVLVPNRMEGIRMIEGALKQFWEQQKLPSEALFQIDFSLEEFFTNVVSHAHEDDQEHEVEIRFSRGDETITVELLDDGGLFNPLQDAPDADVESSLEDRNVGGLGIELAKKMMTELHYQRDGTRNHLTITKKI